MRRSKRRLRKRKLANYEARRSREFYRLREQARLQNARLREGPEMPSWMRWAYLALGVGLVAVAVYGLVKSFVNT